MLHLHKTKVFVRNMPNFRWGNVVNLKPIESPFSLLTEAEWKAFSRRIGFECNDMCVMYSSLTSSKSSLGEIGDKDLSKASGSSSATENALPRTDETPSLYPGHVPLTFLQKGVLSLLSSVGAASDPRRADLVAIVGETTGGPAFRAIRDRMLQSEEGRKLLLERPRVSDANILIGEKLPRGTFGYSYAEFMRSRGFSADERPPVRFVDDPEIAWVATRSREVHDFWHVLFGCHTNVFGEVALKALEFVQTGIPMTGMAVAAGIARLKPKDRKVLIEKYLPWAVATGSRCADLMPLYYENYFAKNLDELREIWRIEPAPQEDPQNRPQTANRIGLAPT